MEKVYSRTNWENYPSVATPINENNLNKMDHAIDELDNRVLGLDTAKFDKSTANEKFAELDTSKLDKSTANTMIAELKIKNNAKGESIHLKDSDNAQVVAFAMYGKSEQKQYSGNNFIPFPYTKSSYTENGIEWTVNADGSVTANGTATERAYFRLTPDANGEYLKLKSGTYTCSITATSEDILIGVDKRNKETNAYIGRYMGDTNIPTTFSISESDTELYIPMVLVCVPRGKTIENAIFKPMLVKGDTAKEYEPYVGGIPSPNPEYPQEIKNVEVSEIKTEGGNCTTKAQISFVLRAIEVSANDDYTYEKDGKYYIADTIEKVDGGYKYVQRIYSHKVDVCNNYSSPRAFIVLPFDMKTYTVKSGIFSMCNRFKTVKHTGVVANTDNACGGQETNYAFRADSLGLSSAAEWTAWFQENETIVDYVLAEPIVTTLSDEEIAEIEKLHTFYPATNVSNDSNCYMSITYVADTKNYIDNKIASLETALYNNV